MDRDAWNDVWSGKHHEHRAEDNPHHGAGPEPLLVELVADVAAGRALDLGCGMGANSIWLAAQGWEAIGVDFSDVAVSAAQSAAKAAGAAAHFVQADVTTYAPQGPYDLITLFYVHLTAAQQVPVLQRAAAALAPGGWLLFVGHDRSDAAFRERIDEELLSTPEVVVAALGALKIERAEVVQQDAHGHGASGTTLVLGRRVS